MKTKMERKRKGNRTWAEQGRNRGWEGTGREEMDKGGRDMAGRQKVRGRKDEGNILTPNLQAKLRLSHESLYHKHLLINCYECDAGSER